MVQFNCHNSGVNIVCFVGSTYEGRSKTPWKRRLASSRIIFQFSSDMISNSHWAGVMCNQVSTLFKETVQLVNLGFTRVMISIEGPHLIHYDLSGFSLLGEEFNHRTYFNLLHVRSSLPHLLLYGSVIINQQITLQTLDMTCRKEFFISVVLKKANISTSLIYHSMEILTSPHMCLNFGENCKIVNFNLSVSN